VTAGIDLALALVEADLGRETALAQYDQWVTARRPSRIPEAARMKAPVQTEATRRACAAGLTLAVEPLTPMPEAVDTLIVAGGPGVDAAAGDPELLEWLRRRTAQARRVASVSPPLFATTRSR
jgi:transcriptional regulator GlxA family with amidase domain